MQTLLIYLPGKQGASRELLEDAALGELLDSGSAPSCMSIDPPKGPDGCGGVVAFWGQGLPAIDDYVFEPGKGSNRQKFWLGKPKGAKLAPAELAREKMMIGAEVLLADSQAWLVPIARQLPELLGLGDDGRWSGVVLPQYREFYDAAWRALEWLTPGEDGLCKADAQIAADFACRALSINYRVNRDVASFLGLLTSDTVFEVARAAVEFHAILAAGGLLHGQKKTGEEAAAASASPAIAAGGPG